MTSTIDKTLIDELIEVRHKLHEQPEVSGKEEKTAAFIKNWLQELSPSELYTGLGGHGVAAVFDSGKPGKRIMIRAELDALPITEINDMSYKSQREGTSHKCGHDGHMAILLGLACSLQERPPAEGSVLLLFQPAEETGAGARQVLEDERFADLQPHYAFALHNLPGYPMHSIVVKNGAFTASVNSIIIKLQGKTAHAAQPETGTNPALTIARILQWSDEQAQRDGSRKDFCLLTPVYTTLGEKAYGVAAGYGEVHLTLRAWREEVMQDVSDKLIDFVQSECQKTGLTHDISWTDQFIGNYNDKKAMEVVRGIAGNQQLETIELEEPLRFGEDFGAFSQEIPGAMFGLGSGKDTPALHNPDYDFPDELIETGLSMFRGIIDELL